MTSLTRRDALYALLSASIGGILPARPQDPSSATSSATRIERHDFEPVRDRILKATASGTATGVAVARRTQRKDRLGRGLWMGESRGSRKSDLSYAVHTWHPSRNPSLLRRS